MTDPNWRLLRGGAWFLEPHNCRAADRGHIQPVCANGGVGFRVICPDPVGQPIPLDDHHD